MTHSKHLLTAVAVAAALAGANAAQAETTLFGRAGMTLNNSNATGHSAWDVKADDAFIGVEGKEDLGDGLSAVYFYKFVVNADGSSDGQPFQQKESWVGLKGNFGRVVMGRMEGPYDNLIDSSGLFDPTGTPFQLDPGIFNNTVRYDSPKYAGLQFSTSMVMNGTRFNDLTNDPSLDKSGVDLYNATLLYKAHGIRAGAGYMNNQDVDTDMYGVDLRYGNDDFQVGATWEQGDMTLPGGTLNFVKGLQSTGWGIAGQLNFGNNVLLAHGGRATSDLAFAELDEYALGVQHWFSKRTHAYIEYERIDYKVSERNDTNNWNIGMRHDF